MKSDKNILPYNPFFAVEDHDSLEGFDIFRIPPSDVPDSAAGFREPVSEGQHDNDQNLRVLSAAAEFIVWSSQNFGLPESEVINHRRGLDGSITLVFPSEIE